LLTRCRLTTWYLLLTILLRCPPSLTHVDADTPRVCSPYLHARAYATPYLSPYYNTHIAPHVHKAKPYADRFHHHVFAPAAAFTRHQYAVYGAHRVDQAKQYAEAQYDKAILPQVHRARDHLQDHYDRHLGHHVKRAENAAAPYYDHAKASLADVYHSSLLPAYHTSLPYMRHAHAVGHHFLVDTLFPYVNAAKDVAWAFLLRTVWPQVRILYGDNVEPQLVRISERLGRYRDQHKVESVVQAADTLSSVAIESTKMKPTLTSSPASLPLSSASPEPSWSVLDDFSGSESSSKTSSAAVSSTASVDEVAQPKLTEAELQEKLNQDLRLWQTKFATAADKGAEDLEQRVADLTTRQVESAVKGHGRALLVKLEETAESTIAKLKSHIQSTVKSIPEDASEQELEATFQDCSTKIRELGLVVKERAQNIRAWKAAFDIETDSLVQAAVRSTVEVLEKIHGLGLQEVGMRWAWTDGVTYKDWQNYHKLRSTLNEWQAEVEAVGARHEGLRTAHEEAKKVEDEAMTIAANIVTELVRLKDVSKWKIWAGDASDDFSDKKVPVRVHKAAQQVLDTVEGASAQVSEAVLGSSTPRSESLVSSVKDAYSAVSSHASEVVQSDATPLTENIVSSAKSAVSEGSSGASVVTQGTPPLDSLVSQASSKASDGVSEGSSIASAAYESPEKVFGGVNAQAIPQVMPVVLEGLLDDGDDHSAYYDELQNVVADAGERAAELSRAISEALLGATKTQGSGASVSSLASEQYSRAFAAASSVLYGTKQPAVESATRVASDKFAQAVTAASHAIYGTPTPTAIIHTVQIHASSRYHDAVRVASEQLENAKSQLSILVSGTPKPAHQTMLSYFERAYSDSIAAANERLSAALQYTESFKNYAAGPTQGYFDSVSSIASSRLASGLSQASAQFSSQPTGVVGDAQQHYYQAIGLAHARYSEFMGAASSAVYGPQQGTVESLTSVASASAASAVSAVSGSVQSAASYVSGSAESIAADAQAAAASLASQVSERVVGTETPWTESVASQASQNWEALISKASSQVYGKPTPWAESIFSQAGSYGAQATAVAAQQYADVQALISELVVGKEPEFTKSVMNRFASAYSTGLPAAMASAQSYASEGLEAASSYAGDSFEAVTDVAADAYASASSVVGAIFTPPAVIEDVLGSASASLDLAVSSASIALYGTPKGAAEQASESVASAYSSIQSQIHKQVYGTQQAQDNFSSAARSAQAAISAAIFGTPTAAGYVASATSGAGGIYSSISSVASENAASLASAASSAVYGPEQGAMESANRRIQAAVQTANSRIAELYRAASVNAEDVASSAVRAAAEATARVKDEL